MRGELLRALVIHLHHRITPAYAGRTSFYPAAPGLTKDHPRVCGENLSSIVSTLASVGSPPRMRGEPQRRVLDPSAARITPAYAGRTAAVIMIVTDFGDHPRVCGENSTSCPNTRRNSGSPPRMRGEPVQAVKDAGQGRITPAYAGRTDG